jgi:hypothetical protein
MIHAGFRYKYLLDVEHGLREAPDNIEGNDQMIYLRGYANRKLLMDPCYCYSYKQLYRSLLAASTFRIAKNKDILDHCVQVHHGRISFESEHSLQCLNEKHSISSHNFLKVNAMKFRF